MELTGWLPKSSPFQRVFVGFKQEKRHGFPPNYSLPTDRWVLVVHHVISRDIVHNSEEPLIIIVI